MQTALNSHCGLYIYLMQSLIIGHTISKDVYSGDPYAGRCYWVWLKLGNVWVCVREFWKGGMWDYLGLDATMGYVWVEFGCQGMLMRVGSSFGVLIKNVVRMDQKTYR